MYLTHLGVGLLAMHGLIHFNGAAIYVPVSALLAVVLVDWLVATERVRQSSSAPLPLIDV
jgi:hypothetical protein